MLLVFPWLAAVVIAATHFLIDLRTPIDWWSRLIGQTQPQTEQAVKYPGQYGVLKDPVTVFDIGLDVRIWADQTAHIAVIALVALVIA